MDVFVETADDDALADGLAKRDPSAGGIQRSQRRQRDLRVGFPFA